jgi:uncharacterized integral membrane protein
MMMRHTPTNKPHIKWWQHLVGSLVLTGILAGIVLLMFLVVFVVSLIAGALVSGLLYLTQYFTYAMIITFGVAIGGLLVYIVVQGRWIAEHDLFARQPRHRD